MNACALVCATPVAGPSARSSLLPSRQAMLGPACAGGVPRGSGQAVSGGCGGFGKWEFKLTRGRSPPSLPVPASPFSWAKWPQPQAALVVRSEALPRTSGRALGSRCQGRCGERSGGQEAEPPALGHLVRMVPQLRRRPGPHRDPGAEGWEGRPGVWTLTAEPHGVLVGQAQQQQAQEPGRRCVHPSGSLGGRLELGSHTGGRSLGQG